MNLIRLNYDSTNFYLIEGNKGWIMVDTGWAGTFPKLAHQLKQRNVDIKDIRFLIITHYHPDHAGIVEDIKDLGVKLILHRTQVPYVGEMKRFFKPKDNYREIRGENNIIVDSSQSRTLLNEIDIKGEIVPTPGHSPDSISLIIDEYCAFTGDLPGIQLADSFGEIKESWKKIKGFGIRHVYPGHGEDFNI